MKVLITGSTGRLGKELTKIFPNSLKPTHRELDITKKQSVYKYIKNSKPNIVIHCAALTDIRKCEANKKLAYRVNVKGTEILVNACKKYNAKAYFIYISTVCVFYGDRGDYVETDIPNPKNYYALTKLLGEFVVKYSIPKTSLIIRTNFVPREKWPYPKAFIDRYGTYLFADDLAQATTPDIKPMTLEDYSGPPLTVDMSLKSKRIKPFHFIK